MLGASRTTRSDSWSPGRPPSRYCQRRSGETTYGALQVIRSKTSPSTGSKRLPRRVSTFVDAVQRRADLGEGERACIDVGRDHVVSVLGREQRVRAVPVPMSSARATRRRGVSAASQYAVGEKLRPSPRVVLAEREAVEGGQQPLRGDDPGPRESCGRLLGGEPEREQRLDASLPSASARVVGGRDAGGGRAGASSRSATRQAPLKTPTPRGRRTGPSSPSSSSIDSVVVADGAQRVAERRRGGEVGFWLPHARTAYGARRTP